MTVSKKDSKTIYFIYKGKKLSIFSYSLLIVGALIIEKLYILLGANIVGSYYNHSSLAVSVIINVSILVIGLLCFIITFFRNKLHISDTAIFALAICTVLCVTASVVISISTSNNPSTYFILYTIFFLVSCLSFVVEYYLKKKDSQ